MKQFEKRAAALSDASAVLQECSNMEDSKLPRVTIMTPHRVGYPDQKDDPPMSVTLQHSEVKALYEFLHEYYSESENRKPS